MNMFARTYKIFYLKLGLVKKNLIAKPRNLTEIHLDEKILKYIQ